MRRLVCARLLSAAITIGVFVVTTCTRGWLGKVGTL